MSTNTLMSLQYLLYFCISQQYVKNIYSRAVEVVYLVILVRWSWFECCWSQLRVYLLICCLKRKRKRLSLAHLETYLKRYFWQINVKAWLVNASVNCSLKMQDSTLVFMMGVAPVFLLQKYVLNFGFSCKLAYENAPRDRLSLP